MHTKMLQVSITIPFPFDKPDGNGVVYTKDAIEKALPTFRNVPIIIGTPYGNPIGTILEDYPQVVWDEENNICLITVNGVLRSGGTNCNANVENGAVVSFDVQSVGICSDEKDFV